MTRIRVYPTQRVSRTVETNMTSIHRLFRPEKKSGFPFISGVEEGETKGPVKTSKVRVLKLVVDVVYG